MPKRHRSGKDASEGKRGKLVMKEGWAWLEGGKVFRSACVTISIPTNKMTPSGHLTQKYEQDDTKWPSNPKVRTI